VLQCNAKLRVVIRRGTTLFSQFGMEKYDGPPLLCDGSRLAGPDESI